MASTNTIRFVTSGSTVIPCMSVLYQRSVDADERGRDDFVGAVHGQGPGLGVGEEGDEVEQIARVERAGVGGECRGKIRRRDDLDVVTNDRFVLDAQRAVAALTHGEVHDDGAWLHPF